MALHAYFMKGEPFQDPRDPLRQRDGRQEVAQKAQLLVTGELPPEAVRELPWHDASFCCFVLNDLKRRADELRAHKARFKVLREVFGPGSDPRD